VVNGIGGTNVPVVIADFSKLPSITPQGLESIGYTYDAAMDKWHIGDAAADFVYTAGRCSRFRFPVRCA
jgi:(E)-4-hydroxy-3-methylbut-2-enyl-diphosphate synthase